MTTHIIGKPPAPKGGATPRDPEPDPAVTTYGELEPGGIVESDGDLGIRTWEDGTSAAFLVDLESGEPWQPRNPVRRVSASVVVHEEPGTHVWPDDADSSRVAILEPESGRMSYDRAEAETIIRQLTAWLAQEPASPESGEPEPAELQAGDRIGVVFEGCSDDVHGLRVGIVKRQPAEDRSKPATEEVERWRVKADDLRKLVSAKRIEAERLRGQLAEARAEVQRLRESIRCARVDLDHLTSRHDANLAVVAEAVSADVELRAALAREDGGA